MAKKYIDAERLIEGLKELEAVVYSGQLLGQSMDRYDRGQLRAINNMKELVNSLQQEQSAVITTPFIQTKPCEGQEMSVSSEEEQPCDTCTNDKGCVTCKDGELWEGKEQPSEDLEEEITRYLCEECSSDDEPTIGEIARHFANWQKEQMGEQARKELAKTDITLADLVAFDEGLRLGRRLERQDMLKDAVEGLICATITGTNAISFLSPLPKELMAGDKVKIVIIPEKEDKK